MASSSSPSDSNIPDYEYKEVYSNAFHLASFRNLWLGRLSAANYSHQEEDEDAFDADFAKEMGLATETMDELKAVCSLDSLRCHPEDQPPDTDLVPQDSTLKTLIQRKKRQDYKQTLTINRINRHDLFVDELESLSAGKSPEDPADKVPEGELMLSINIYYPAFFDRLRLIKPHMTLMLMGSHSLADLRDAICCYSDLQVCGEFSNTPDLAPDYINKDHYKSAFFFIEGVFYNDMRYPECRDISSTTMEWAKSRNFPPYSQSDVVGVRLVDLKLKVGFPYLYCHQGDCEHIIIVTDVRLAHKDDCLDTKLYPLLIHKHRIATRKCAACHIYIARWVTTNDKFAPSDPCLFCDKCFRLLHYDNEDNKLGNFLAFPYVDPGAFN